MGFVIIFLISVPVFLCGVNALLNRLPHTHSHRTPFTAGFYSNLILIPVYVALHVGIFGMEFINLVCGIAFTVIYINSLVFLNWFVFTLTDVSMHIQILMQVQKHKDITPRQLVERYNKNTILGNRIPRLLKLGQLRLEGGLLFTSGRSVLFGASICAVLRTILGIPVRPEEADHNA